MLANFWSIVPPLLAIALAIRTKHVYLALLGGIWFGWFIMEQFNPLLATVSAIENTVAVFKDPGSTRTIIFCALIGALIRFFQFSGGVAGLIHIMENKILGDKSGLKIVQALALLTGMLLFIETSISILVVGAIFLPLFKKMQLPPAKLAYIADSGSAPTSILLPFNAWGAFLMALMAAQGLEKPFMWLLKSIPFNFYPIFALIILLLTILTGKEIGPMKKRMQLALDKKITFGSPEESLSNDGVKPRMLNMMIPMLVMLVVLPSSLFYTGWPDDFEGSLGATMIEALGRASGSSAVLYAISAAIVAAAVMYKIQGIKSTREIADEAVEGVKEYMPLAFIMVLAFAMGDLCKAMGTGQYLAGLTSEFLSPILLPAIIFIISGFTAFATGTSFGTFAVMMPIAVPIAMETDAHLVLCLSALMGGGVFGDHCSPISDTTIISSMATGCDHIQHVRTQIPYALLAGALAVIAYVIIAYIMAI
ncbi:MAG: sodium:solute symporter [Cyclobacteriaceae bacterium]|nr:sodium:solute symporter [Cyclobacteriaceae bacterium]